MLALTLQSARDSGLAIAAGALIIALVLAWLIRTVVAKLVMLGVFALLAAVVWFQRTDVTQCADDVRSTLAAGAVDDTTCMFFGQDVTVSSPRG